MTIITEANHQWEAAKPLEFITDSGISTDEGTSIINNLKEILEEDESLFALSAPQIGINSRVFCIKFSDGIKTFINPIITKKNKESFTAEIETCASMPGKEILISRPNDITIIYYNDEFKYEDNKLLGVAARLFDQQYQLLDGITPADYGMVFDTNTDGSLKDAPEEIIQLLRDKYLAGNANRAKLLQKEITEDELLANQYKKLNFAERVVSGEIAVVESEAEAANNKKAQKLANSSIQLSAKADKVAKQSLQKAQLGAMLSRKKRGKR